MNAAEKQSEVILDVAEIPFIQSRLLRKTVVDKFKISDDNMLVAFTLDIGNTERLTAGFKDMTTGKILPKKLE